MKRYFILLLLISELALPFHIHANHIEYGLHIQSFPLADSAKTSVILENNKPLKFYKETTLSFDMMLRRENAFGMVFRILTNHNENIDLSIAINKEGKRNPMLIINESLNTLANEVRYDTWIPVSITFSSSENKIYFSYDNETIDLSYKVSRIKNIQISFGISSFSISFPNYVIYDIASVNIRNIKYYNRDNLERYWKFEKNENTVCHDSIANVPAILTNPKWIIDDYASWIKQYSKTVSEYSLFTYNQTKDVLYIVPRDKNEIIAFSVGENKEKIIRTKNAYTKPTDANRLIYDELKEELVIYNLEEKALYRLSFDDLIWKPVNQSLYANSYNYWNSSRVYSPEDSTLYSFGGYGYLKFNNELLRLNVYNDSISKVVLGQIPPRFFSAALKMDHTFYVFGGKGSKTGRQEISPRNYYDLYSVDLSTLKTTKILELSYVEKELLLGENMVYDEKDSCFYLITDINDFTLIKLEKTKDYYVELSLPSQEKMQGNIHYRNLYLSPDRQQFYTLLSTYAERDSFQIGLYFLNYPPLDLHFAKVEIQKDNPNVFLIICGIIILLTTGVSLYCLYRFRKKRKLNNAIDAVFSNTQPAKEMKGAYYDFSKQSICFLGGFTVMDKNGFNITKQFSPTLKHFLLLLILSMEKDTNGITSKNLTKILWVDKSNVSAKNNRNVYISKLRVALENVGDVEISNVNDLWKINLDRINCDYTEAFKLFSLVKTHQFKNKTDIIKLIEILYKGVLLPNTEIDWIDSFKSDFSNLTIDVLTDLSQHAEYYQLDDSLKLKIAEILFHHDYLNEDALYIKIWVYFNAGKKGIAKNLYESFCKEYFSLMGTKYKWSFSDILAGKNI